MYKVITKPASLAVSLDEIKRQLNIEPSYADDDTYLNMLISSAQTYVEKYTMRLLVTQTVQIRIHVYKAGQNMNGVHGTRGVYVPSPASAIISINAYTDHVKNVTTPEDKTNYHLDDFSMPTILSPIGSHTWPDCDYLLATLTVGIDVADIDTPLKHAIMILAADAYENRIEQVRDRDNNVGRLLDQYRSYEFVDYEATGNILQYLP